MKDFERPGWEDLLRLHHEESAFSQAYETLVGSLQVRKEFASIRTIMVTSARPAEGKTTVALNLAIVMTLAGRKVLLVDGDLRKPRLHQVLGLDNEAGFSDLLFQARPVGDLVRRVAVPSGNDAAAQDLAVITSGRCAPHLLKRLRSADAVEHMAGLAGSYDTVLIDTAPVLAVSDGLQFLPFVQGVLLVLNTGIVNVQDAQAARERLESAGGRILGLVMNNFDQKRHGAGLQKYYSDYAPSAGR